MYYSPTKELSGFSGWKGEYESNKIVIELVSDLPALGTNLKNDS